MTDMPVQGKQQKGGKAGRRGSRRAKMKAARANNIAGAGKKVRTRAVQVKKDARVFRHSNGKYSTVAEMVAAGEARKKER